MATKIVLLLLLGLSLRGKDALSSGYDCTEWPAADSVINLRSLIRSIVRGDVERIPLVQQMAALACNNDIKGFIYDALWQELQQDNPSNDPQKILDFYILLEDDWHVPPTLKEKFQQAFVSQYAQLLSPPFHNDNRSAEFPEVNKILSQFSGRRARYLANVFEVIFADVRSTESIEIATHRLSNLNAGLNALTWANLELLNREEVSVNSSVHRTLMENLRQLVRDPSFNNEVYFSSQMDAYRLIPSAIGMLDMASKVRFRLAFHKKYFLSESEGYVCLTNNEYTKFQVRRGKGAINNATQFSFENADRDRQYLVLDPIIPNKSGKAKNVKNKERVQWWHAEQVKDGIALYDADTSSLVLCGNPTSGDDLQGYAYTRRADDFDAFEKECTWYIEDEILF